MAKIVYDFYDGKDIYNDGSVEDKLLRHYRDGSKLDFYGDGVWYLTTDIRANILEWYPFEKKDSVLEIGGGSGTLTSVLCQKAGKVVSVEGSKRRAEIICEKNKQYKNLEVIAGNYGTFSLKGKYDYIVLVGVFEYAKRFFPEKEDAFLFFLTTMRKNLKKGGKILIAIENRYGIKYWAGAKEDHLLKSYVGLEGYESTDIGTFGKDEFVKLIKRAGFSKYRFYYPFPDYKLPEIIYSDQRLPEPSEIPRLPIYLYDSKSQFEIHSVLSGLLNNNIFDIFSNSYIVEFGLEDCELSDIDYVKYQNNRNKEFRISTIIRRNKDVIKSGMTSSSKKHLENQLMIHKSAKSHNLAISDLRNESGNIVSDYIVGKNFNTHIGELLEEKRITDIIDEIDRLYKFLKSFCVKKIFTNPILSDLKTIYKGETLIPKMSLMDFNSSNMMVTKRGYLLIDQEWLSDKEIPMDYLMSNSLSDIYICNPNLSLLKDIHFFLRKYNITETKIKIFEEISKEFFTKENKVINLKEKEILDGCKYKKDVSNENGLNNFVHALERLADTYESTQRDNKMSEDIKSLCSYVSVLNHHGIQRKFYFSNQTNEFLCLPNTYEAKHKGNILLLIHELSRTGAPVVLADAAKTLYDTGYFVTVLSLVDGPLKEELLDYGIPVIVSEDMHAIQYMEYDKKAKNVLLDSLVSSYDKVLMCTATLVNFVRRYSGKGKEIYWWLHEGPESWSVIGHLMPKTIGSNIKIVCGGQYVIDQLREYGLRYKCSVLNYGVEDKKIQNKKNSTKDIVKFLLVGTICERKGQEILLKAIQDLPPDYMEKAEFTFIGSARESRGEEILSNLNEYSSLHSNIRLISDIPRENLYDLYRDGDVLVVPSFDDPMPVVATENFMLGNICVCSNMTGTSYYIKDGENGFVFEAGNVKELADKIIYIIKYFSEMDKIKQNSRKIYEENFSMERFKDNLLKLMNNE